MEDLISFFMFVLQCVMWYYAFKALLSLWDAYSAYREAKELEVDLREKLTTLVHSVKPEKHADVHYWFDEQTDRFLAQGRDLDEIQSHLRGRFTKDIFLVEDKILLAGPEYTPMDISKHSANDVGKYIADNLLPKILTK